MTLVTFHLEGKCLCNCSTIAIDQEIRAWLINTVQQGHPSFIEQLLAKDDWHKTATILGGGIIGYTSISWASIMNHVIVMLQDVTKRT